MVIKHDYLSERELGEVLRSWESYADFNRCDSARRELLARAAATPIASAADAAAALDIVLLAATDSDGLMTIGGAEDRSLAEIVRATRRWLDGSL